MELGSDYETLTAGQMAEGLACKRFSALELFEAAVRAIEAKDDRINAVVVRDFDRARGAAETADRALAAGERRPLLGVPMTVKESHFVAGLPVTWGLAPFRDFTPSWDSVGVSRLKAAGAVILGKTNVPPGLGDFQSDNPIYGRTNNPHDLARTPGGSSGGAAAALAAGMIPLEFGSDIGGSIRIPAHFCGVFGHKPSYGIVPLTGHAPPPLHEPTLGVELGVVGPLARSAEDLALALGVLAGPDGEDAKGYSLALPSPRFSTPADLRVLIVDVHPLAETDEVIRAAVEAAGEALETEGARVTRSLKRARLPNFEESHGIYSAMLGAIFSRGRPGGVPVMDAHAWMDLLAAQHRLRRAWAEVFTEVDVVLAPAFGAPAFPHVNEEDWSRRTLTINGAPTPYGAQTAWAGLASLANLPATCAPAARTREGLPLGVQVIGAFLDDRTTIAVGGLVSALTGG